MKQADKARSLQRLVRLWHSWRVDVIRRKLKEEDVRCKLLKVAEREYGSSYFTCLFIDSSCRCVRLAAALEYHSAHLPKPNDEAERTAIAVTVRRPEV